MLEWIQPWEGEFLPAFWEAKRAMTQAAEETFRRHGVREGQQFVLMCLWREDGLTPGEIARRLGLATPTVTRTATRMASAGLVERRPHPTDARLVRVHLTERGEGLRDTLNDEMRRLADRALHGLGEQERREFTGMLRRLRENLAVAPARPAK
ncbi:DNA-binding MarR family transcriptional regulator [Spinactinospora alkalitolerans]|uniref:DNA-binding MarR family transcriptional regulator n=1 Tax=Spinactinospora alkalitolerans TaxID=687207 RepID=A0A852TT12_9ACTN|nr:MarR family transcriptional regulator [Spinactinospora alkalitolerans]NYE45254.1 DNA-binding MarR family transcriptional regulator [Spinactinospora alkalitolerans]